MRGNDRWYVTRTALLFAFGLLVLAPGTARASGWSDDFEAYTAGEGLKDQSPDDQWTTWDDSIDPAADGTISAAQAASGTRSLQEMSGADVIGLLSGVTDGVWSVKAKYFLPAAGTGNAYFIMLSRYPDSKEWAYQLTMNLDTGMATDGRGTDFALVRDAWAELQFDIDLDANTMVFTYDGAVVNPTLRFSDNTVQLEALDLYSESGGPIYIDDVSVTELAAPACGPVLATLGNHDDYQPLPDPPFRESTAADDGCDPGVVVNGTGGDIWGNTDSAHYLYERCERLQGNFDASVLIQSFENPVDGANDGEWARAGFMVRASNDGDSPNQFIGVNMRGMPDNPNGRKLLHSTRTSVGGGTSDNRQDDFHTPIWVRLRRVGDAFTSYYKYDEGDDWTEFATRATDLPDEVLYGYAIHNHGGNQGKPPYQAVFCQLEVVKLPDISVSNVLALPEAGGVRLTWDPAGAIDHYEIARTDASGTVVLEMSLAGAETAYLDTTAIAGNTATYGISSFDAAGETLGPVSITYYVDLTTDSGAITTWVLSPHYQQGGGSNPPAVTMALDYLTDGAGVDETNFIPGPGATVATDYAVAQSTGCTVGSNTQTSCDPPTFFLYQSSAGAINFNNIFGDVNDVMTYMITYVTNTTGETLHARFDLKPDDGAQVLLDNTTWYFRTSGCCNFQSFYVPIPPGEHRVMVKIFEGGGGHNGELRVLDWDTGQPFEAGALVTTPIPTMTEVPPALPFVGMDAPGNVLDWLISAHLQQPGGANPSHDAMARDYLTDGAGVDETTILPEDGTTVATDFAVAESTGCTCGAANPAGCGCDPVTFFQYTSADGYVNFSSIFGDTDNVMTYMVTYVTNTTGENLLVRASLKPDDSAQVLLDNITWYFYDGCCSFRDFPMFIPPGEHRLMIKIFEGGGGHDGHLRLLDSDGKSLPSGALEVRSTPTITELPPAPSVIGTRAAPAVATSPDPVTITIQLDPVDATVDVYELIRAPFAAPTNISSGGVFDPASETIFWDDVTGSVSYDVVPFDGQPNLVGAVDDGVVLGAILGRSNFGYLEPEEQEGWLAATIADSGQEMSSVVTRTSDDPELFSMTIVASGHDIWDSADDFRYVWKEMPADGSFVIQGRLDSFPRNTNDWAKAALMVRADASQGSPHVQAAFRAGTATAEGDQASQMQWRDNPDSGSGNQDPLVATNPLPYWVRGVYENGQYSGYFAPDVGGQPGEWVLQDGSPHALNTLGQDTILAGVAVTSHDDAVQVTAEWSNVQIFTIPSGVLAIPGDANLDSELNITDPVLQLGYLFSGDELPACTTEDDGATLTPLGMLLNDWTGDGAVNITDATASLNFLFSGGVAHVLGEGCRQLDGAGCDDSCAQ